MIAFCSVFIEIRYCKLGMVSMCGIELDWDYCIVLGDDNSREDPDHLPHHANHYWCTVDKINGDLRLPVFLILFGGHGRNYWQC